MENKIKVRIKAKEYTKAKYAIIFMGIKLAVAFDRDSGAKVGYEARLIEGEISSGGSKVNWYCYAEEGSIFELEVDREFYTKNKNRIKKWEIEEIEDYSVSKERADELLNMSNNLE